MTVKATTQNKALDPTASRSSARIPDGDRCSTPPLRGGKTRGNRAGKRNRHPPDGRSGPLAAENGTQQAVVQSQEGSPEGVGKLAVDENETS